MVFAVSWSAQKCRGDFILIMRISLVTWSEQLLGHDWMTWGAICDKGKGFFFHPNVKTRSG
jgi:hypothetical protein